MDIHFILAGRPVTPDNWRSFGPEVTKDRLDRLADDVEEAAGEIRCARHRDDGAITCRGPTLSELDFEVAGCCADFNAALAAHLRQRVPRAHLRSGEPGAAVRTTGRRAWRRMNRAFGPILAGFVIDAVDLATFGPIRHLIGFPAGALAGYWMGSVFKLPWKQRLLCALAAGVYCVIPGHSFIPLATMLGAYVRFRDSDGLSPDPG